MTSGTGSKAGTGLGLNRRDFLIVGTAGGAGALAAPAFARAAAAEAPAPASAPEARVVDVAKLADLRPDAAIPFAYPDPDSPALLVALTAPGQGGVGPGGQVVAFSQLCTHKGCPVNFLPNRQMFVCPCHWSSFDPAKRGQMVIGQGSAPLPQIRLRVRDGIVQAYGVDGLIYGRHTNIL
ncbi:MAG: arsenate reductase (azurin) small subunit [Rhodospirillales bacterium]|nr:arsenate reductase (azurin) small subunit [Rhodospirillales bacterium]